MAVDRLERMGERPLWAVAILAVAVAGGCATQRGAVSSGDVVVSATFGSDGRLWRAYPRAGRLYVDHSDDHAQSFSAPVAVSPRGQRVLATPEDRPQVAVSAQGRVYVSYAADQPRHWVSYLGVSDDGGERFAPPVALSDRIGEGLDSMDRLALSPTGVPFLLWYEASRDHDQAVLYMRVWGTDPTASSIKVYEGLCACCRMAVDFDAQGQPVILARFVYPGSVRDHGMMRLGTDGARGPPWRVTDDGWRIAACPEHGPALSIAGDGRYHVAWFTQGARRKGLFYAYSNDAGGHYSEPLPVGTPRALAGHPQVRALGERVVLVWQEYDGAKTRILAMQSEDRGVTWSAPTGLAASKSASDYPFLVSDGQALYLSWNSLDNGYLLVRID